MDTQIPDRIYSYWIYVTDALPIDREAQDAREWLSRQSLGSAELSARDRVDAIVLDEAAAGEMVTEQLLEDHPEQPLEKWWWHLGAIRRRDYPADRLPEHLRAVYQA